MTATSLAAHGARGGKYRYHPYVHGGRRGNYERLGREATRREAAGYCGGALSAPWATRALRLRTGMMCSCSGSGSRTEEPRRERGSCLFGLVRCSAGYETGTVSWSERVESSKRLIVAVVNATSVTVAVHLGFGHDPAGAEGASVVTVYGA